jgi:lipopolysaccharide transport system permease protein
MTRTVVRTNEPPLARPGELIRRVWSDLLRSGPLAVELAKRDIRAQYRQSLFGPAVVVLSPIVMTGAALGFRRTGILHVDSAGVPYALFALVGVILWLAFAEALNAPIHGFLAEQRMLTRTCAPPEAIVLGKLGALFLNVLIRTSLLAVAVAGHYVSISAASVLAPIGVASLMALGTAVGLLIAPLNLLYRDLSWVLTVAMILWFFFSPVYFPPPSAGPIGAIMRLNPVTPLLSGTRSLVLTGTIPNAAGSVLAALGAFLLLAVCGLYTRVVLSVAIEHVNE